MDHKLAGVARFELTNAGIKTQCLTAWRYPNDIPRRLKRLVSPQGFEPRTHGLEGRCSIQLSYEPTHNVIKWSGRRDSNSRPSPWQGDALPLSHFRTQIISSIKLMVEGGGFEPPKAQLTDLQSAPFGHSGIPRKLELVEGIEPPTC